MNLKSEITRIGGIYVGLMRAYEPVTGLPVAGGYYASGKTRMEVITKLLSYARIDGHIPDTTHSELTKTCLLN